MTRVGALARRAGPMGPDGLPVVALAAAVAAGALLVLGGVLATLAERTDPPLPLAVAGGLGLLGVLALALARYDAAAGLAFLLLGIVTIEPAPVDAVFAIVMAVALVTGRFGTRRVPLVVLGPIALLLALNLLSLIESVDLQIAARFLLITVYLLVFSVWLAGWLDSSRRARLVVRCWLIVGLVSAVLGSAALFLPIPGFELLTAYDRTRAVGLFDDPNVFGPFLVPVVVIVLEDWLNPRLLRRRPVLLGLLIAVLLAGITFSYSRAAWGNLVLAVVIMLAFVGFRRRGGRAALRLLVVIAIAGAIGAVLLQSTGSVALLQERAQLQGYDSQRFGAQRLGVELSMSHPIGIGPGQFEFYSPVETHSTYVRVLAEQGILGLVMTVALFGATLLMALSNALRQSGTHGIGSAALLGAWCGILLNSFVVDTLHWRHLWVVAPLIWIGWATQQASKRSPAH